MLTAATFRLGVACLVCLNLTTSSLQVISLPSHPLRDQVRSAAVWTHNHRVAFVISVLEASASATAGAVAAPGVHHTHLHNAATHHHGIAAAPGGGVGGGSCPIKDGIKLARLRQLLLGMMDPSGQDSVVNVATTKVRAVGYAVLLGEEQQRKMRGRGNGVAEKGQ